MLRQNRKKKVQAAYPHLGGYISLFQVFTLCETRDEAVNVRLESWALRSIHCIPNALHRLAFEISRIVSVAEHNSSDVVDELSRLIVCKTKDCDAHISVRFKQRGLIHIRICSVLLVAQDAL